jgi:hypothetical protein
MKNNGGGLETSKKYKPVTNLIRLIRLNIFGKTAPYLKRPKYASVIKRTAENSGAGTKLSGAAADALINNSIAPETGSASLNSIINKRILIKAAINTIDEKFTLFES